MIIIISFIAARVIGREQAALSKTLWINKGSAHGLKVRDAGYCSTRINRKIDGCFLA